MNLKSLPVEDRMEHVRQISYTYNMSIDDFRVMLEGFGISNEDFFDE
ncbi:MAG: hypothetical protein J6Q15_03470 [Clostridia bacterium]|nr:hypothetical protein [Clostridia bacterium]